MWKQIERIFTSDDAIKTGIFYEILQISDFVNMRKGKMTV